MQSNFSQTQENFNKCYVRLRHLRKSTNLHRLSHLLSIFPLRNWNKINYQRKSEDQTETIENYEVTVLKLNTKTQRLIKSRISC